MACLMRSRRELALPTEKRPFPHQRTKKLLTLLDLCFVVLYGSSNSSCYQAKNWLLESHTKAIMICCEGFWCNARLCMRSKKFFWPMRFVMVGSVFPNQIFDECGWGTHFSRARFCSTGVSDSAWPRNEANILEHDDDDNDVVDCDILC